MTPNVLIIDDDKHNRFVTKHLLRPHFTTLESSSVSDALNRLENDDIDLLLLDYHICSPEAKVAIHELKERFVDIPLVIMVISSEISKAIQEFSSKADDWVIKEESEQQLVKTIKKQLDILSLQNLFEAQKHQISATAEKIFVPDQPKIKEIFDLSLRAAKAELSLFIQGETGTGKNTLVNYIHRTLCPSKPLITIDELDFSNPDWQVQIFGDDRIHLSQWDKKNKGKLELANGGILYLDEINSFPKDFLAKLNDIVSKKYYSRIEGKRKIPFQCNVITSSSKDIHKLGFDGKINEELLPRLSQVKVRLPRLATVPEVIDEYVHFFTRLFNKHFGSSIEISTEQLTQICARPWKGNIREIKNYIRTLIGLEELISKPTYYVEPIIQDEKSSLQNRLEAIEKEEIRKALTINNSHISKTADYLELKRTTLQSKIKKYKIIT